MIDGILERTFWHQIIGFLLIAVVAVYLTS